MSLLWSGQRLLDLLLIVDIAMKQLSNRDISSLVLDILEDIVLIYLYSRFGLIIIGSIWNLTFLPGTSFLGLSSFRMSALISENEILGSTPFSAVVVEGEISNLTDASEVTDASELLGSSSRKVSNLFIPDALLLCFWFDKPLVEL